MSSCSTHLTVFQLEMHQGTMCTNALYDIRYVPYLSEPDTNRGPIQSYICNILFKLFSVEPINMLMFLNQKLIWRVYIVFLFYNDLR